MPSDYESQYASSKEHLTKDKNKRLGIDLDNNIMYAKSLTLNSLPNVLQMEQI